MFLPEYTRLFGGFGCGCLAVFPPQYTRLMLAHTNCEKDVSLSATLPLQIPSEPGILDHSCKWGAMDGSTTSFRPTSQGIDRISQARLLWLCVLTWSELQHTLLV